MKLPEDIELLRLRVLKAITPICDAVENNSKAEKDFLITAQGAGIGRELPPYYLCYFLFVELLGFKNLGRFEKISWSIPLDYKGVVYLLEHRKFGIDLFFDKNIVQNNAPQEIVKLIVKSTKIARPYFEWLALEAIKHSELNVLNHSRRLHDRFNFFLNVYQEKHKEAIDRQDEKIETRHSPMSWSVHFPYRNLKMNAEWLAISAIDAFFSLTEHVFIHAAIIKGNVKTGEEVANLADSEWSIKFKSCLDANAPKIKGLYDKLVTIRRQIRNYFAHGAFGKRGEAFQMHSAAGAIPLLMPHQKGNARFSMDGDLGFDESEALSVITDFLNLYWESKDFPEVTYIRSDLPSVLTYAGDGTYAAAMQSSESMELFVDHLVAVSDNSANMDW